jgi:hypothetical protein
MQTMCAACCKINLAIALYLCVTIVTVNSCSVSKVALTLWCFRQNYILLPVRLKLNC